MIFFNDFTCPGKSFATQWLNMISLLTLPFHGHVFSVSNVSNIEAFFLPIFVFNSLSFSEPHFFINSMSIFMKLLCFFIGMDTTDRSKEGTKS